MDKNNFNFSGGPGVLPLCVLKELSQSVLALKETGYSILGLSHRSDLFLSFLQELKTRFVRLLHLPENYRVLFLQGGATTQFAQTALYFSHPQKSPAQYIVGGYWSEKALVEALRFARVEVLWNGKDQRFTGLPENAELTFNPNAAFLHYVSNETVEGLQFPAQALGLPNVPRVVDMSSDLLSRPINACDFSLIYAHAQKNLGPAGVTIVIVDENFLPENAPLFPIALDYQTQWEKNSNYNTPPVFAIYAMLLVLRWLEDEIGGLDKMHALNFKKQKVILDVLKENPEIYRLHAQNHFSLMNIAFFLNPEFSLENFLQQTSAAGFYGLKGHRALGGVRASLYNALPLCVAEQLADFLHRFAKNPR